jgi:hypothetical protein
VSDRGDWLSSHRQANRDAKALALNMLTGDVQASLDLILPMDENERIAVISALATDLASALRSVHGGISEAVEALRAQLLALAERT